MVRSIGADHVIDYTQQDFTQTGQRYDLILEMAGNRSLADLRRALTPKGTLVLVGGSGGKWFMGTGRTLRAVLIPFVGQRLRSFFSKPGSGPGGAAGAPGSRQSHPGHRPNLPADRGC